MEINLQTGFKLPQALPSARSADTPVVKPKADTGSVPAPRVPEAKIKDDAGGVEDKRVAQLTRAAANFFKDVYAVSDTTFTIFKDSTGQYVTRFYNLRDGKVTYIPEPKMMQYMESRQAARESLVELRV